MRKAAGRQPLSGLVALRHHRQRLSLGPACKLATQRTCTPSGRRRTHHQGQTSGGSKGLPSACRQRWSIATRPWAPHRAPVAPCKVDGADGEPGAPRGGAPPSCLRLTVTGPLGQQRSRGLPGVKSCGVHHTVAQQAQAQAGAHRSSLDAGCFLGIASNGPLGHVLVSSLAPTALGERSTPRALCSPQGLHTPPSRPIPLPTHARPRPPPSPPPTPSKTVGFPLQGPLARQPLGRSPPHPPSAPYPSPPQRDHVWRPGVH